MIVRLGLINSEFAQLPFRLQPTPFADFGKRRFAWGLKKGQNTGVATQLLSLPKLGVDHPWKH